MVSFGRIKNEHVYNQTIDLNKNEIRHTLKGYVLLVDSNIVVGNSIIFAKVLPKI